MEPTSVRVGVMDSQRPVAVVATIPARHLGVVERLWRAAKKLFGVSGILLLLGNMLLMMLPFPHLHLCLFPIALLAGPLLGWLAWKNQVVLASHALACPRCHVAVMIPADLGGWPARFNCEKCGIRVELNPAASLKA